MATMLLYSTSYGNAYIRWETVSTEEEEKLAEQLQQRVSPTTWETNAGSGRASFNLNSLSH
jgi:hypothetical protein